MFAQHLLSPQDAAGKMKAVVLGPRPRRPAGGRSCRLFRAAPAQGLQGPQLSPFTGQSWLFRPPTTTNAPKPSPHPPRGLPVGRLLRLTMDGGADEIFMSQQINVWGGSGEWDWVNSTAPRFCIIIFFSVKQKKQKHLEPTPPTPSYKSCMDIDIEQQQPLAGCMRKWTEFEKQQ